MLTIAYLLLTCTVTLPQPFTLWSRVGYDCRASVGGPVEWTLVTGALPAGLVLDPVTGLVSQVQIPDSPTNVTITIH